MITEEEIVKTIKVYGYHLAKLSTYVKQLEIIVDRLSDNMIFEAAPCYFKFTIRMYWQTIIIELIKLYSNYSLSLHKIICWCEQNKGLFPNKKTRIIKSINTDEECHLTNEYDYARTIATYRKKRAENEGLLYKIRKNRDKIFVHMDKDYCLKTDKYDFETESKITMDEVKQLIEIARELINALSSNASDGIIASEYANSDDVKYVFNFIECGKKHYKEDAMAEHRKRCKEQIEQSK